MQKFRAQLQLVPHGGQFVVVPPGVAAAAGLTYGKRVRGTCNGVPYRSSLMKYSGVFHMGVHKATLEEAGAKGGDTLDLTIEIDEEPLPADTVPPDFAKAIDQNAVAKAAWKELRPSHKREHVNAITEAKKPETRARRIEKAIEMLSRDQAGRRAGPARGSSPRKAPSSRGKK